MRKSLIFICLLFASVQLAAQDADILLINTYNAVSDSLAKKGEYKVAILNRKKALNLLQAQNPVPYTQLVSSLRTIGYYYRAWGNFKESLYYQKRAVELAEGRLDTNHIELAKAYNGFGGYYYGMAKFDQSLAFFNKALQIAINSGLSQAGDYYNNVGICHQNLGDVSAALTTYQKALNFNRAKYGFFHKNLADNHENLGTLYYNLGRLDTALFHLDSTEIILDSLFNPASPQHTSLYNNKGAVLTSKGDYRNALFYLEEGLKLFIQHGWGNHPEVANIYSNIGLLLQDRGDLDKALTYFTKSLAIREKNFEDKNPKIAKSHVNLGNCYLEKKNFDKAYEHLNKGLNLFQQITSGIDPSALADARNELGLYFERIGNYNEALNQYNQALKINANKLDRNDPDVANSYARIGNIHLLKKGYALSTEFFQRAKNIRLNLYGSKHADVAEAYRSLALSCPINEACIEEYLNSSFRANNYFPEEVDPFDKVFSTTGLLKTLQAKGSLLFHLYVKKKKVKFLTAADEVYRTAIELIKHIKTSLEQPGSRLSLQDNYYLVYEEAILVKYMLYEATKEVKYWEQSFEIAERSNATLLIEALQSVDAERFAGIPDSLLILERNLKVELSFLEKQRFEEELKNKQVDPNKLNEINDRIFRLHVQQHELISNFQKYHKDYFKLKYEPKIVSIDRIQKKLLRDDQTMIAYFVGENNLFAFIISKKQFEVVRIPKDFPLEIWVEEFRESISRFNPADNQASLHTQKLANIGFELHELLLAPLKDKLHTESLLIVPGGVLGYLPFDALLASPAENYIDFDDYDYLINHFQISYSYSATLLDEMISDHHKRSPLIAFAPVYYGDTLNVNRSDDPWRAVLGQLRFNVQEATNIHQLMGGELYTDSLASEEVFMKRAPEAGIIHLATHGKANDRHGEYSYMAFYQFHDSLENELLFVKNLYNMKIPASLVVLSACETGIGELQRGEGIISLARGFSYAGAASIVTTLWSIDDNASANIMLQFYKNLRSGQTKDASLRNAKLDYFALNKGNNRTHPLFWAAFVPTGNMEPLIHWWDNWPYIGFGILLLGSLVWFIRKRP